MSRTATNADKVREFMRFVGNCTQGPGRIYLAGGASAALIGWRDTTMDIDIKLSPEPSGLFVALDQAKETLDTNIELAAPDDFIPPLPGWRQRSVFIDQCGLVRFLHYDFYGQALAKICRGHPKDLRDVEAMHRLKLIEAAALEQWFDAIKPNLPRFPSIDPARFRAQVRSMVALLGNNPTSVSNPLDQPTKKPTVAATIKQGVGKYTGLIAFANRHGGEINFSLNMSAPVEVPIDGLDTPLLVSVIEQSREGLILRCEITAQHDAVQAALDEMKLWDEYTVRSNVTNCYLDWQGALGGVSAKTLTEAVTRMGHILKKADEIRHEQFQLTARPEADIG